MIIWSGWGFLVAVIVFACSLFAELITRFVTGVDTAYQNNNWILSVSLLVSAGIVWFVGKRLNRTPDKVLLDQETGQEVILSGVRNKMFFIRMEYWGPILVVFAIINLFQ